MTYSVQNQLFDAHGLIRHIWLPDVYSKEFREFDVGTVELVGLAHIVT